VLGGLEDVGVEAVKTINDGSVTGALAVLLIILMVWREVFYWPKEVKKREDENDRCHAAHDQTRAALLAEVGKGGETLVLVREQLRAMESHRSAVEALMRVISDKLPSVRRRS
jgi:hypothetical protein